MLNCLLFLFFFFLIVWDMGEIDVMPFLFVAASNTPMTGRPFFVVPIEALIETKMEAR
jgi:hypothetical protein